MKCNADNISFCEFKYGNGVLNLNSTTRMNAFMNGKIIFRIEDDEHNT